MSINRLKRQRSAQGALDQIFTHPESVLVIHYSCESFYDRPDGSSPRITSIAVRNLASAQTQSFSIHQVAERDGVDLAEIEDAYNQLERHMLEEFFEFVNRHQQSKWLHWNMRDINYGFAAIEHRIRALGGEPIIIAEEKKYDLARLLIEIYGVGYIEHGEHGRLASLIRKNNITDANFLNGAEEAQAFEEKNYVGLHQSTLRKVDIFANIATRAHDGTLKTNATWWEIHGVAIRGIGEYIRDHPWFALMTGLASIVGLIFAITTSF